MKKNLAFLVTFILFCVSLFALFTVTSSADTEGYYTYSVCNYQTTITDVNSTISGAITIPSTLGGYPVTSIGNRAFEDCISLTSITIPEGVASIGSWGFYGCTRLESITIPESMTSIGHEAIYGCTGLKLVAVDSPSVANALTSPASCGYLMYCAQAVALPLSVTEIGSCVTNNFAFTDIIQNGKTIKLYANHSHAIDAISWVEIEDNIKCSVCGVEKIVCEAHTMASASCDAPSICLRCGCTEGDALGHEMQAVACESPALCLRCDYTEGEAIGHTFGAWNEIKPSTFIVDGIETRVRANDLTHIETGATMHESVVATFAVGDSLMARIVQNQEAAMNLQNGTPTYTLYLIGEGNMYGFTAETLPYAEYLNAVTEVVIDRGVTSVGSCAFIGAQSLHTVTISEGVTSVGYSAFSGCTSLTSITLPEGVTSIGSNAFRGCTDLASINLPESLTSIDWYAFYQCISLKAVNINDLAAWCEIDFGDSYANPLYYAKSLYLTGNLVTDLVIPEGVTSIGSYAFEYCTNIKSLFIPEGVTSVGSYAFYHCTSLATVTVAEKSMLENVGKGTFGHCTSLTSITLPSCVTSIGDYAFFNCEKLASVTIPASARSIGAWAFYHCTSMISVTVPESVTSIGDHAFRDCAALVSITFAGESKLTSIGSFAFYACESLYVVYNNSDLSLAVESAENGYLAYYAKLIINKDDSVTAKSGFSLDKTGEYLVETRSDGTLRLWMYLGAQETVTLPLTIDGKAYQPYYMRGVGKVIIPEGMTSIGERAFSGCKTLTSVTIPESVTSIGSDAFYGTAYYDNTFNWENDILYNDKHLIGAKPTLSGAYVIRDGTNYIAASAFRDCINLTSITIPESVVSVGAGAFSGCESLEAIAVSKENTVYHSEGDCLIETKTNSVILGCKNSVIPSYVTSIGDYAFSGCTNLTSITIPAGVTSVGAHVFSGCEGLEMITVSKENTVYHSEGDCLIETKTNSVISGCKNSVIPSYVTNIGDYAFFGCASLTSIAIPAGVTNIGNLAFYDCTSLGSVFFAEESELASIGHGAFYRCVNLEDITIPENVTSIGFYALHDTAYYDDVSNWENDVLYNNKLLIDAKPTLSGDYSIKDGTRCIGDFAFYRCEGFTSIVMPDSVTSIGAYAFGNCSALTHLSALENVTIIGEGAFKNCTSLRTITIGEGATLASVGTDSFAGCGALRLVVVKNKTVAENITEEKYAPLLGEAEAIALPKLLGDGSSLEGYAHKNIIPSNNEVYVVFAQHSHAADAETWEETQGGKICIGCGIVKSDTFAYVAGDINGDGSVTILDIVACVDVAAGVMLDPAVYPGNPDVNGDGSVTILDIIAVVDIASGK